MTLLYHTSFGVVYTPNFLQCSYHCSYLDMFYTQEMQPSDGSGTGGASMQKGFRVLVILLGMTTITFF